MRNMVTALASGAALLGLSAIALAAAPEDRQPEARAYVNFKFGGSQPVESFFYGLRLDHDSRYTEYAVPAIMGVEFDSSGFSSAAVNGVKFAQTLRLNQAGGAAVWTAADWGLLAAGVVGLGFVAVEVSDSDDSPAPGGSTGGGGAGGGTGGTGGGTGGTGGGTGGTGGGTGGTGGGTGGTGGGTGGTGGGTGGTGGGLGGLLGGFTDVGHRGEFGDDAMEAIMQQRVLDGGTGQMGDLIAE